MIIRTLKTGETAIIAQTEHSRFVGQLAAHWGNERFARPEPYATVARAAAYHDYGWLPYETNPQLNRDTGKPYQFSDMPFMPESLNAYQACIDALEAMDLYAGWIVGKHRTGLYQSRYGTITQPAGRYSMAGMRPEIATFVQRNEARQAEIVRTLDATQAQINYRLLQVWDLLGLYFCCRPPVDDIIEPVPDSYSRGDGEGVRLGLTVLSPWRVQFSPYPFDVHPFTLNIHYKRSPKATYGSQEEWLDSYYHADNGVMTYSLE